MIALEKPRLFYQTMTVACNQDLRNRVSVMARNKGVSRSSLLRSLIEHSLKILESQQGPADARNETGEMNPSSSKSAAIYLASPYSHPDASVRQQRFEAACRAAAELFRQGATVFSPIAHSHAICGHGLPLDWRFWQRHDQRYLEACDEVMVLMLDGWQESVGVQAEIAIARELGKPVSFIAAPSHADAIVPA